MTNDCLICKAIYDKEDYWPLTCDHKALIDRVEKLDEHLQSIVNPYVRYMPAKEGTKHDSEKIRLELLPTEALEEVAKVLSFGAKKYGDWNWAHGMHWSRLLGAAMRHLFAFARRESHDPETNISHLAHVCCCGLFLLTYQLKGLGTDDRPTYRGKNE